MASVPFLTGASLLRERVDDWESYPFNLPILHALPLKITAPMCIFVGENGTGKSTLLQALAELSGLPALGGGKAQLSHEEDEPDGLYNAMRPQFRKRPKASWYARGDRLQHFIHTLKEQGGHHAYGRDADAIFADRDLETLSHGEALLATLNNRARAGLLFLDEPEAALSPSRQLSLCALLATSLAEGATQVIMATHSPLLMSFPGAQLLSFDETGIHETTLEQTSHYQVMRGVLECPERYWRHLIET
jgi:predicted ATPase